MLKQRIEILDENINKLNLYISKENNSKNKVSQTKTKINIPNHNESSKNNKVSNTKSPRNNNENSNTPTITENNNEGRDDISHNISSLSHKS